MSNALENMEYNHEIDDMSTVGTEVTELEVINEIDDDEQSNKRNPHLRKLTVSRGADCYKIMTMRRIKKRRKGKVYHTVKKVPLYFYETSSNPGSTIRDAITGQYHYGYLVGKAAHEDQFYKTAYCVGDALKPGQKLGDNKEAQFLYYMNPESYERHFHVSLTAERKEKWYNLQIELKNKRNNNY